MSNLTAMTATRNDTPQRETTGNGTKTHDLATVATLICGDSMKQPERWVARQIHAGRFPARKVGRHWRMTDADVAAALDALAPSAQPVPVHAGLSAASQRRRT